MEVYGQRQLCYRGVSNGDWGVGGADNQFSSLTEQGYRLLASLLVLALMDHYLLPEGSG